MLGHGEVRQRVQAVVAGEAVGSVRFTVLCHEFGIQLTMAAVAGAVLHGIAAFVDVAVGADHFGADTLDVVVGEVKIGQVVVKNSDCGRFQIIVGPQMFQVAAPALRDGG